MSRCEADLFVRVTVEISRIGFIFDDGRGNDFDAMQVFRPFTDFDVDIIRSSAAEAVGNAVAIFDESRSLFSRDQFLLILFRNL